MLPGWLVRLIMRCPGFREPQFKPFYAEFKGKPFDFLDVGCGNHSASRTKAHFSRCRYYGLDNADYNNNDEDYALMERFFRVDLEQDSLAAVPENHFEIVMMHHVLEHLRNGLDVVARVARKVKVGGYLYIEFPSVRSLDLPSAPGTLHFCDDASHVRLYSIQDVANILLDSNFKIVRAGRRRDTFYFLMTPFLYTYTRYIRKSSYAGTLWDFFGFSDVVIAQRKP